MSQLEKWSNNNNKKPNTPKNPKPRWLFQEIGKKIDKEDKKEETMKTEAELVKWKTESTSFNKNIQMHFLGVRENNQMYKKATSNTYKEI